MEKERSTPMGSSAPSYPQHQMIISDPDASYLTNAIHGFSAKNQIKPHNIYLFAWAIVLSIFEGRNDVSTWALLPDIHGITHFQYHLDPSLSVLESLQLAIGEGGHEAASSEVERGLPLIAIGVELTAKEYSPLLTKVSVSLAIAS